VTARIVAAIAVVAASLVLPAPPAGALPILDPGDAIELANTLAEATEEQGVCYGWIVTVQDDGGSLSGVDRGSSLGPDSDPNAAACAPRVVFVADLHYTSSMSESPDSATYHLESTLPGFDARSLDPLGVSGSALLGGRDDLTVINATGLLPVLVAEQGLAPPVPAEETVGTIPATDRPTGKPSSDRLRTHGVAFGFAGFLVFGGLCWVGLALVLRHLQRTQPDLTLASLFDGDDD
jgi:hypothetical protein